MGARAVIIGVLVTAAAGGAGLVITSGGGVSCTGADVTTSTFASRVSGAAAGDVLCLSQTADYGDFLGAAKTSPGVTIMAKPSAGVTPLLTINFDRTVATVSWFTFDGVKIGGGHSTLCAPAHDITFKNAEVANEFDVKGGDACGASGSSDFSNSAIVFDNMTFTMAEDPTGAGLSSEGRLSILRENIGTTASGVLVKNSLFTGNCADGITTNTGGFTVQDTEFTDIIFDRTSLGGGVCGPHADPVQFFRNSGPYGANATFTRVYIHDSSSGITQYVNAGDITAGITITNSVFANIPPGAVPGICDAICLHGGSGHTYTHNTLRNAGIQNGSSSAPTTGTVLQDNIMGSAPSTCGACSYATNDHNFCTVSGCTGTGSLNGAPAPSWVGGSTPTTFAGYALTGGSRGTGVASDSTNIGVNP